MDSLKMQKKKIFDKGNKFSLFKERLKRRLYGAHSNR